MQIPTVRRTVRRILASVFLFALIAGVGGFYLLLQQRALDHAASEARILLTSALAIREYTSDNVLPKLSRLSNDEFHEETVPSFAAQTVFRKVARSYDAYSYREPALNPTSPADLATPFEVELIQRFRNQSGMEETSGIRAAGGEQLFYLARPIRVTQESCLACHSTPDRAPPAMVAKYGSTAGFGWRMGEVVAVQVLTVPVTEAMKGSLELVAMLGLGLALVFTAAYLALTLSLDQTVVRPLQTLSRAATAASQSNDGRLQLPRTGAGEVRDLADAIERLRVSLRKAMRELGGREGAARGEGRG